MNKNINNMALMAVRIRWNSTNTFCRQTSSVKKKRRNKMEKKNFNSSTNVTVDYCDIYDTAGTLCGTEYLRKY